MKSLITTVALSILAMPALSADVPPITPADFHEEASFIWALIAQPDVVAVILSALAGVFGLIMRNRYVQKYRLVLAVEMLEAAVRETYEEYVREAKASHADGKLTQDERNAAIEKATAKGVEYCRQHGFNLLKMYAREYIPVLIGRIIGVQKAYGRANPLPLLPELDPRS